MSSELQGLRVGLLVPAHAGAQPQRTSRSACAVSAAANRERWDSATSTASGTASSRFADRAAAHRPHLPPYDDQRPHSSTTPGANDTGNPSPPALRRQVQSGSGGVSAPGSGIALMEAALPLSEPQAINRTRGASRRRRTNATARRDPTLVQQVKQGGPDLPHTSSPLFFQVQRATRGRDLEIGLLQNDAQVSWDSQKNPLFYTICLKNTTRRPRKTSRSKPLFCRHLRRNAPLTVGYFQHRPLTAPTPASAKRKRIRDLTRSTRRD